LAEELESSNTNANPAMPFESIRTGGCANTHNLVLALLYFLAKLHHPVSKGLNVCTLFLSTTCPGRACTGLDETCHRTQIDNLASSNCHTLMQTGMKRAIELKSSNLDPSAHCHVLAASLDETRESVCVTIFRMSEV
jgi:hypothetical protein